MPAVGRFHQRFLKKLMLRIHFLNVGHGDCTIISHPSGRLTMIDINNSQDYDDESFQELLEEERRKADAYLGLAALATTNPLQSGLLGAAYNPLSIPRSRSYQAICADAVRDSKNELTDPIKFLNREYPGHRLFRFILTHPDLDHGFTRPLVSRTFGTPLTASRRRVIVMKATAKIGNFTRRCEVTLSTICEAIADLHSGRTKMMPPEATTSKYYRQHVLW
jgi:hypothetical protein